MAQKIIGIDIGTYSVKAVVIKSKLGGGFEYIGSFSRPLDKEAEDAVTDALIEIVSEEKLGNESVIAAISAKKLSTRLIKLPFTNKRKIDQIIDFEIENYLPFSKEAIVTDYQLISKEKDGSSLFVQSAQKDEVQSILSRFEKAGVEPKHLDSELIALHSVLASDFSDGHWRGIVDIGHNKTIFTISKNNEVVFSRAIDFGGALINERISKALHISSAAADELKRDTGHNETAGNIINQSILELAGILKQNIISFELNNKAELKEILLSGGSSRINGICEMLEASLDMGVKKLGLSSRLLKGNQKNIGDDFAAAYGLALRGRNLSGLSTIDFRSDKTSSSKETKYLLTSLIKVFVMALVLIVFYSADLFIEKRHKERSLNELDAQLKASFNEALPDEPSRGNEIALIKEKINEAVRQAERVGAMLSKDVTTLDILNEISVKITDGGEIKDVEIYECSFDGKRLNILGETQSYNLTDEIKKSLETSDMFEEVKMDYAKFTADQNRVKFSMRVSLKEKGSK